MKHANLKLAQLALAAWLAVAVGLTTSTAQAQPSFPGFIGSVYADVTDPQRLTFAPDGTLYVGRDNLGSGGSFSSPAKIHRVAVGGVSVTEYGQVAIPDPDTVLYDVTGSISGTAGSVIVGSMVGSGGQLSAVLPDESVVTLFGSNPLIGNPHEMLFDSTGRMLLANLDPSGRRVLETTGATPTQLFQLPTVSDRPIDMALDGLDQIYTRGPNGTVQIHDSTGTLVDASFASLPSTSDDPGESGLDFGAGGAFGTDLYAAAQNGEIWRIDSAGTTTVVGTGFNNIKDVRFGPDGFLYVSEFDEDRVWQFAAPDGPSNASFSTAADVNVLNIDFGTISAESAAAPMAFDVANLAGVGFTATLESTGVVGSGDTAQLATDFSHPFALNAGDSQSFSATFDNSVPGAFIASYDLNFTDLLGTNQTITLNLTGESEVPGFASNASFSTASDQDILNLDFGTVALDAAATPLGFDLANLLGAGTTANLDLVSIAGTGKTGTLATDLAPFADLFAGDFLSFEAALDTSLPGLFGASYELSFTDILGTNQTLTLNLSGEVVLPANDPNIPDLIYDAVTGEVILDPDGSSIIGYSLKNDSGAFLPGNFNPVLGGVATATSIILEEATLGSLGGPASIGNVFPTGMDITELFALLSTNHVSRALGSPLVPFDLIIVVPEPSTYAMAALAFLGLGIISRGRRRRLTGTRSWSRELEQL
ncbi:MAG: PEP-CTERM sorting domain-containing protein [Planctomycetota bacterium]|nr:MAG: PEP-CTERM sorting domain-containing protein [Planctomycetota bacterium]